MDILDIARESNPKLFDEFTPDEVVKTVEYLVEGNTKEDLALMYMEALGRSGWEYCIREYIEL